MLLADSSALHTAGVAMERLASVIERVSHAFETMDGEKLERLCDTLRKLGRAFEDAGGEVKPPRINDLPERSDRPEPPRRR